jgi:multidrug efflux pump subunit AcrA (membrane-fusion protein)
MARLTRVAPVVGADHVLPVMATMDNPDRALLPGMSGTAAVTLATKTHVTMVPREAIVDQGGHPAVFVLEDMHVHARAVDLGLDGGRLVEIVSGVVAGNLVVTPAEGLVDGDVFVGAP